MSAFMTADEKSILLAEVVHLRVLLEARDRRIGELLVMNARLEKVAGIGRYKLVKPTTVIA